MSRILIIDDEPAIGWTLGQMLADEGHAVEVAASVEEGLDTCGRFVPDAMLLDVRLAGRDGIASIPDFRARAPDAPVIVMTAFGDLDTAVRAVRAGAFDYLVKPFDLETASRAVSRALAEQRAHDPPAAATASVRATDASLVGSSPAMQEVFKQISLVAPTDLPVLVTGATGTGKDLAARAIHAHSPRHAGPFVAVSLAALAPGIIESELFGHVRGSFTGASSDRPGLFELAAGGTVFLDEIGEVPLDVQVKLLRAIENRVVTRAGAVAPTPVDVRVIAATNRDLEDATTRGQFRADLYHRLRAFPIVMPPLTARIDDLEALAVHFLHRHAADHAPPALAPDFVAAIRARPWPGNVRELKHAVEYAAVVARGGMLRSEHLPPRGGGAADSEPARSTADAEVVAAVRRWARAALDADGVAAGPLHGPLMELVEATLVQQVVEATDGNRTAAARLLGVDRATLRSKLSR